MRRRVGWAIVVAALALALPVLTIGTATAQDCGGVLQSSCPTTTGPTTTTTLLATTTLLPSTTTTTTVVSTVPTTQRPATTTSHATTTTPARTTQPATTTTPTTTTPSLLVPGTAPDAGAGGTVGSTKKISDTSSDRTGTVVAIVITGLLLVALLFALVTWRFWRNTRPAPDPEPVDEPAPRQEPVGARG